MDVVVEEDVPECQTESVTNCAKDPATGEEVCKDWPKQVKAFETVINFSVKIAMSVITR